jgi:hypothetical protein
MESKWSLIMETLDLRRRSEKGDRDGVYLGAISP